MRILAPLVVFLSSGLFASSTLSANPPDRPPGVDADHWVSLGASIGVVLTSGVEPVTGGNPSKPGQRREPVMIGTDRTVLLEPTRPFVLQAVERAEAREPMRGYIMIEQGGIWRRLMVDSP